MRKKKALIQTFSIRAITNRSLDYPERGQVLLVGLGFLLWLFLCYFLRFGFHCFAGFFGGCFAGLLGSSLFTLNCIVYFPAMNRNFSRSSYAQADFIPPNIHYGDLNIVTDHNRFISLSAKNQHF